MNERHITGTNIRLFLVLDALLTERNVTRAATRLGLTQSAVSHALQRLRQIYADPLFVRGPVGMMPTPLALDLAAPLRSGLGELERVLNSDVLFDPRQSRRIFSVATVDHLLLTGMNRLLPRLQKEAPGIDLRVRPIGPGLAAALGDGSVDTALAGGEVEQQLSLDRGLMRSLIASEDFVCILRSDHPLARRKLTLEAYTGLSHLMISTGGRDTGMVDSALAGLGLRRRLALTVPGFAGAPILIAASDLIATVPRSVAEWGRRQFGLRLLPPPLAMPKAEAFLWWHQRFHNEPGHRWWRRMLLDIYAPLRRGSRAPA